MRDDGGNGFASMEGIAPLCLSIAETGEVERRGEIVE